MKIEMAQKIETEEAFSGKARRQIMYGKIRFKANDVCIDKKDRGSRIKGKECHIFVRTPRQDLQANLLNKESSSVLGIGKRFYISHLDWDYEPTESLSKELWLSHPFHQWRSRATRDGTAFEYRLFFGTPASQPIHNRGFSRVSRGRP